MYIYNRDLHMLIFIYNRYIHMNPVSLALLATSGVCVLSRETTLTNIMITQMDKYKAAINKWQQLLRETTLTGMGMARGSGGRLGGIYAYTPGGEYLNTANLRTDSGLQRAWLKQNLKFKGWNSHAAGDFQESLSQRILVWRLLVWRLHAEYNHINFATLI